MTRKKIIIVGFGVAGKRYFNILKKKNIDILILKKSKNKIIYKNNNIAISREDLKDTLLNEIDLIIIASPVKTHWYYLKLFLRLDLDIIVEKPVIYTAYQFNKLKNLIKKFDNNFYINHSDLYNQNLINLIKNQKFKNIKKIIFYYGNDKNLYKVSNDDGPILDWLPHILAVITFFLKEIHNFKIYSFSRVIKKGLIYEKSILNFNYKKILVKVHFSNFPKKNLRTFRLYHEEGYINFDSYNNNNFILKKNKKITYKFNSKKTFDNLIDIALKNLNKKKQNDFYLFEKYFKIYEKVKLSLLSEKKNIIITKFNEK